MASKKHYYRFADILGTFNFHLENNLKGQHWPIREDLGQELTNLIDGMKLILKDDNKDFREDLFQDEINSVLQKRRKEYEEERKKELQENSEIHSDIVNGYDCDGTPVDIYEN